MNIAFFLKRRKKIMFRVTDSGERFVKATGLEVDEPDWDPKKQRAKGLSKKTRAINAKLQSIEDNFFEFVYSRDDITLEEVRYHYSNSVVRSESENIESFDLSEMVRSYFEGLRSGQILKRTGERASLNTISTYKSVSVFVDEFVAKNGDVNIKMISKKESSIQKREVEELAAKIKTFSIDSGYLNSSTSLRLNKLKQIINFYVKRHGLSLDNEALKDSFQYPTEDNDVEIIEPELFFKMVDTLSDYRDYQTDDCYRACMDFIIVACKTGARISDAFSWVKSENFLDGKTLRYRQMKKRGYKDISIPVDDVLSRVFNSNHERYGALLPPYSYNHLTDKMRDVLGLFEEFLEPYRRIRYIGQNKVVRTGQRREFISPHTFRASLASVMLMKGVDRKTVMKITGHSPNSTAFARYENVSEDHKEEVYMNFWGK